VVLKAVKPGVRETLERDARLLRVLGAGLQLVLPRYQPRRIIREFADYTLREVDLRREASNAESFAANFADVPDVVFPAIHRRYSGRSVLCMQYFAGPRPDSPEAQALPEAERERLVDLGALSIIRMLYRDGFFHADLHPGNLVVLPGPRVGFIDLGMVGRLDPDLRRTLLHYYYALVTGDAESAARYLAAVAEPGRGADLAGFRREVTEIAGRWRQAASFESFSLGQLVLESLSSGAQFRMYFPVELVLMVKALVTFEGVGHVLLPGIDIARVSRKHVRRVFLEQFSPVRIVQEELRGAPDLVDALVKLPLLVTEGLRAVERSTRGPAESPLAGVRGTLLAGFCVLAAALLLALRGPWPAWALLALVAAALVTRGRH
jgi:ubiquinone biosynthesis protein